MALLLVTNWGGDKEKMISMLLKYTIAGDREEAVSYVRDSACPLTIPEYKKNDVIQAIRSNGGSCAEVEESKVRNFFTEFFSAVQKNEEFVLPDWFGRLANSRLLLKASKKRTPPKTTKANIEIALTKGNQKEIAEDTTDGDKSSKVATTRKVSKRTSKRTSS